MKYIVYIPRCMKKEQKITVNVPTIADRFIFPYTVITVNLN